MQTVVIDMDTDIVNEIEKIQYERDAYENLIIKYMSNNEIYDRDSRAFEIILKEYSIRYSLYEKYKRSIEETMVPKDWKGHNISWELDFPSRMLTITKHCEC
jgi:hypothetical protein